VKYTENDSRSLVALTKNILRMLNVHTGEGSVALEQGVSQQIGHLHHFRCAKRKKAKNGWRITRSQGHETTTSFASDGWNQIASHRGSRTYATSRRSMAARQVQDLC